MNKNALLIKIAAFLIVILLASLVLSFWLPFLQGLRLLVGMLLVLFVPGYIWSLIFWEPEELDFIERISLSITLSVTGVPLILLLLYKVGLKIDFVLSIIEIAAIIVIGLVFIFLKKGVIKKINFLKT